MSATLLKRQFITDAAGNRIGVILPIEEYSLIEEALDQVTSSPNESAKLALMDQAADDPLFMADLREAMSDFAKIDAEKRI